MKKRVLWTSAAIASSFLWSTLILGTPTFAAENSGATFSAQSSLIQSQVSGGMQTSVLDAGNYTTTAGQNTQTGIATFAANDYVLKNFTIGDSSVPRNDVIDVSDWQSWMTQNDYTQLHNLGIKGVIVKVSESNWYTNSIAANQIKYARNAGMVVSAYHYVTFNSASAAVNEANFFANQLDALNIGKNVTVIADVESSKVTGDIAGNLKAFWQTMTQRGYQNHVAYTMRYYDHLDALTTTTGKDRTWIAQYPYTPSANSLWNQDFGAWQFSSTGHLPGHSQNLDVSIDYAGLFTRENNDAGTVPSSVSYDPILSQKTVSYSGTLDQSSRADGLYAAGPYYTSAAASAGNNDGKNHNGEHFTALQEATTAKATFVQVKLASGGTYWINKLGLAPYDPILSQKTVSYSGTLDQSTRADGLYVGGPYYTNDASAAGNADGKKHDGEHFTAMQEATTPRATFVQIKLASGGTYWVNKLALVPYDSILSQKTVSYSGTLDQSTRADGLYVGGPYYTNDASAAGNADGKKHDGEHFTAMQEATTPRATFVQIKLASGGTYWVNKLALVAYDPILSQQAVSYSGTLDQSTRADGLYAAGPYYTSDATATGNADGKKHNGEHFTALKEATTARATFVQIKFANGQTYWVNKLALKIA
ncbi:GW dipeptide domain-containing protein [Lacticaseibacillus rhamnosus]|uniref:GW dipeptide domain-containing protein n=1 Tax=Lacticaseibacillus rhamnosus TaxID=47715 RepID=UPI0007E00CC9|nr:GW dipeptide domain-containing protein [Lacticaseibacillus rhamnosus]MCZ2733707.1 GW dipeptide domain-containing protein [Lacticaseibacillus rhamnosus]MCZ2736387.1 GW dipeptide domain-containing protein [Lacticaseibacillus rhamnosus]MCZ2742721.1 GW dipeptide domain-containing protein [Lacticaseibacillus rhamnosus]MCZ2745467.1 GW dipeptide domain-containing protein [Lacticaseibacillus rhamnosus]MCZ2748176.1 GW dipeptide domain-containing protein [Lacticaseibacillus rhamnosus]